MFYTLLIVLLSLVGSCDGSGSGDPGPLEISPSTVHMTIEGTQIFTAHGVSVSDVTWAVEEGALGGSISISGVYRAPASPGTFHVVARRQSSPGRVANATVTVVLPTAGAVDSSFGNNGWVFTPIGNTTDGVYALAIQPDGKIVAAGSSNINSLYDFAVARYTPDGDLDQSFGKGGTVMVELPGLDFATGLAIQPDGRIIVVGRSTFSKTDFLLVRLTSDGTMDPSFGSSGMVRTAVGLDTDDPTTVALQADGKILAGGWSATPTMSDDFAVVRYDADGMLDPSFGNGGLVITSVGPTSDIIHDIVIQGDGNIVAAGRSGGRDTGDFALVRYHPDGSLDPTFGSGGLVTTSITAGVDEIEAIGLLPDGRIIAAGVSRWNGNYDVALARYHIDGTLDSSFGGDGVVVGTYGPNDDVCNDFVIQSDGSIVIIGWAVVAGSSTGDFAIARYDTEGNLDPEFGTGGQVITALGSPAAGAYAGAIQPDGKVIAAGVFFTTQSLAEFALVRYWTAWP